MENLKKEDEVKQGIPAEGQDEIVLDNSSLEDTTQDTPADDGGIRTPGESDGSAQEQGVAEQEQGAPIQPAVNPEPERTFTQSQVNELVGRARQEGRESAMKAYYERYGVNDESELDDLLGRGQSYDDINFDLENSNKELRDARSENALLKSGIDPARWDDAKAILGAKGLEISEETLRAMLPTHQEWIKKAVQEGAQLSEEDMANAGRGVPQPQEEPAIVTKLGNEPTPQPQETDREMASKLFKLDL